MRMLQRHRMKPSSARPTRRQHEGRHRKRGGRSSEATTATPADNERPQCWQAAEPEPCGERCRRIQPGCTLSSSLSPDGAQQGGLDCKQHAEVLRERLWAALRRPAGRPPSAQGGPPTAEPCPHGFGRGTPAVSARGGASQRRDRCVQLAHWHEPPPARAAALAKSQKACCPRAAN